MLFQSFIRLFFCIIVKMFEIWPLFINTFVYSFQKCSKMSKNVRSVSLWLQGFVIFIYNKHTLEVNLMEGTHYLLFVLLLTSHDCIMICDGSARGL